MLVEVLLALQAMSVLKLVSEMLPAGRDSDSSENGSGEHAESDRDRKTKIDVFSHA